MEKSEPLLADAPTGNAEPFTFPVALNTSLPSETVRTESWSAYDDALNFPALMEFSIERWKRMYGSAASDWL